MTGKPDYVVVKAQLLKVLKAYYKVSLFRLFPTELFEMFIDVGHYVTDIDAYKHMIHYVNNALVGFSFKSLLLINHGYHQPSTLSFAYLPDIRNPFSP